LRINSVCFALRFIPTLAESSFGECKCIRAANKGVLSKVLDFVMERTIGNVEATITLRTGLLV